MGSPMVPMILNHILATHDHIADTKNLPDTSANRNLDASIPRFSSYLVIQAL